MSLARQVGGWLLIGLGVGLGYAAVESLLGSRRIIIRDTTRTTTTTTTATTPASPPASTSTSSLSSSSFCQQAEAALKECESRHGMGSNDCRFFRARVAECRSEKSSL